MPVRKISVSLDEAVLAQATKVAQREGVSLSTWLSRAAAEAAAVSARQEAMREYWELYGEPSAEEMRETIEQMKAEGHVEPESSEHFAMRMAALARLHGELPSETDEPALTADQERRSG